MCTLHSFTLQAFSTTSLKKTEGTEKEKICMTKNNIHDIMVLVQPELAYKF